MKTYKKIIFISSTAILILLSLFMILLINISKPTLGKKISNYDIPRQALLIIDTQKDYLSDNGIMKDSVKEIPAFIERINFIQKQAVSRNMIIVYIRQEFSGFNGELMSSLFLKHTTIKGSEGAKVDKRILKLSDNDFTKSQGDAFSNPLLNDFLIKNQVNELFLCGLDGEYCVYSTARGAKNRNYQVNIFVDGIMLGKPKHYNDILQKYFDEGFGLYNRNYHKMN